MDHKDGGSLPWVTTVSIWTPGPNVPFDPALVPHKGVPVEMADERSALLPLKAGPKRRHLSLLQPFSTQTNGSEVPGEQELSYLPTKALSIK